MFWSLKVLRKMMGGKPLVVTAIITSVMSGPLIQCALGQIAVVQKEMLPAKE
jgi:hypothetical protein